MNLDVISAEAEHKGGGTQREMEIDKKQEKPINRAAGKLSFQCYRIRIYS